MKKIIAASLLSLSLPLLAVASTVVGHSNTTVSSGLVGYWPLDGNTTNWTTGKTSDQSGNGNNGSLISMSTSTTPVAGKVGGAFKFNGSNTYVSTPTQSISNAVSVSAWVYSSNYNQNGFIVSKAPVNTQWELFFEGSVLRWRGGAVENTVFCSIPSNNKWHHVVGTQTGTTGTLYIDGVQCGKGTVTAIGNGSGAIEIGRHSGNGYYFKGTIDEARVYNRALSASEVQQLYVSGGGVLAHSNTTTLSTGLVGYWPMDGNTTSWATGQTTDTSGNGNSGLLISMSTSTTPITGKVGGTFNFNGTSYVDVPDSTSLATGNTITVSAWIYPTSNAAYAPFVAKVDASGITGWEIANNTGTLRTTLRGSLLNVTAGALTLNKWQMGTFTYDGTTLNLYLNGTLVGSATGSATINSSVDLWIGKRAINNNTFVGRIDDVRVYNRVLSASEIAQLYKNGGGTVAQSNATVLANGLVGYFPLDGNLTSWVSGITNDLSGRGNNGTLNGLSTTTTPVAGKVGGAMQFSGATSTYVQAGGFSDLGTSNKPYTFSVWVKPAKSSETGDILHASQAINGTGWCLSMLQIASGKAKGLSWLPNPSTVTGATTLAPNTWYHVVNTWSAANGLQIYVNGVLDGTTAQATYSASGVSNYISVGSPVTGTSCSTDAGTGFAGSIDDVRVYNRALSASEISQLYAATK